MSCFKFDQIEIASKDFYNQKQVTDIFKINVSKVLVLDKVLCNDGNNWLYILGFQVDEETIIPLFIQIPKKNIFSDGVSQYDKISAYTM